MRLPSALLATLLGVAACEPAAPEPPRKSEPVAQTPKPAAGPKIVQPQPQQEPAKPDPKPVVKKPAKRLVRRSICGHAQQVEENVGIPRCGMG
jgi:hypothetical protein